ncbi:Cu(I)-responsive transcriptional regulator [Maricaulis salignorans]|uniref:Cu(I)-responsive transcriptional regulator n=1 Tax=Maricaulis salignorans TaxID=144026 RepID=A0A1G9VN56_9PROT|nr:Cu(I)-responsive transcriptional regulator [Maricaulis salignorans]SDM73634.1 Cu(I)-responsive transcriptional regulator [Maricaulis salignorans]
MNIKHAAARTGLPAKTIRYYESIGLLSPLRAGNGYRDYRDADLHKLGFLARARALGFSIEDCRHLLSLDSDASRSSSEVKALAQQHIRQIGDKISELKAMRATLQNLASACQGNDRPDCPIMDELSGLAPGNYAASGKALPAD